VTVVPARAQAGMKRVGSGEAIVQMDQTAVDRVRGACVRRRVYACVAVRAVLPLVARGGPIACAPLLPQAKLGASKDDINASVRFGGSSRVGECARRGGGGRGGACVVRR
jgi:hypothetical protein